MAIKIIYYSEPTDNWGGSKSSSDPTNIHEVLTDPEVWNDDMHFESPEGQIFFIDDLIGKTVVLSDSTTFKVPKG